jgi:hypothetical protein
MDLWAVDLSDNEAAPEQRQVAAPDEAATDVVVVDSDGESTQQTISAAGSQPTGQVSRDAESSSHRHTEHQPTEPGRKKKGRGNQDATEADSKKRRTCVQKHVGSRLKRVDPPAGTSLPCVFHNPKGKTPQAIALWPQYELEAPSQQRTSQDKWIVVSALEPWFDAYVDLFQTLRDNAKHVQRKAAAQAFSAALDRIFRDACIRARRKLVAVQGVQ